MLISIENIKQLCNSFGIRPSREMGQHFLLDTNVVSRALTAAGVGSKDTVVEVGPGLGVLTEQLVEQAKRVIAIELDPRMLTLLRSKFAGVKNLELVSADALSFNPGALGLTEYKVVANIPYQITSRLLRSMLTSPTPPTSMTLLVQKEVAERMSAPGGRKSLLSLLVQLHGQPERITIVPAESFWPSPKVDSALIHISGIKSQEQLAQSFKNLELKEFWQTAKIGFSARRKQLKNNLQNGLHLPQEQVAEALAAVGLEPSVRAQELEVGEWIELAKRVKKYRSK